MVDVVYTRAHDPWADRPSQISPWNAATGQHLEDGIAAATQQANAALATASGPLGPDGKVLASALPDLSATYALQTQRETLFYVDSYPGATDTAKASAALAACTAAGGGWVVFGPRAYTITSTLLYKTGVSFRGANFTTTKITYTGAAGTFLFQHDQTQSSQWPCRTAFQDMTLLGDGTGTSIGLITSKNGTNGGIRAANDVGTAARSDQMPFYSVHRVRLQGFATGLWLESYGHHIQESYFYSCGVGVELVHPEQVTILNCWGDYCGIGVRANNPALHTSTSTLSGHKFTIVGGAYQRCGIGLHVMAVQALTINTYHENNAQSSIVLGNPALPSDTTYQVQDAQISVCCGGTQQVATAADLDFYCAQDVQINFSAYGSANTGAASVPHIRTNGWSKWIDFAYARLSLSSATPTSFGGGSGLTCIARLAGGEEAPNAATLSGAPYTAGATPPTFYKSNISSIRMDGSIVVAATGTTGMIFTLPASYCPTHAMRIPIARYNSSGGTWSTSYLCIETSGVVTEKASTGTSSLGCTLYLTGVSFSISDG